MKKLLLMNILVILSVVFLPVPFLFSQKDQAAYAVTSSQVSVTADVLNVRENADITSKIIDKVHLGDTLNRVSSTNGWVQIKLSGNHTGWVYQAYVTPTENIEATVAAPLLNVRENPGLSSMIVDKLISGTTVTIEEEQEGWAKITTSAGINGWVDEYYITKNSPVNTQGQSAAANQSAMITAPSQTANSQEPLKGKTIVLDPGHGGYDDGTTSITGTTEKALTLETAETVEQKLVKAGANVIMTRTNDTYIPLQQRADLSDQNHADAFISFHYNWSTDPSANGLLDFYYQQAKDDPLAADILKDVVKTTQLKIDGTQFDNLAVLRDNTQPSTLIELGFLSNKQDDSTVESTNYRNEVAQGVYLGLLDYFSGSQNS